MRRLRTKNRRQTRADLGVSNLEKVESLHLQANERNAGGVCTDEVISELAVHAAGVDQYAETRRQVYNEAQTFRQSPFFTQKVRLETKLDEHDLLRIQLEALDSQNKSGALLTESDFYYRYPQCFAAGQQFPGEEEVAPEWTALRRQASASSPKTLLPQGQGQALAGTWQSGDPESQTRWTDWLERQRQRGWFPSSTLAYSTLLGAVLGASNFTTYWSHLQIWESSMFVVPYVFYLFTVGLPALQLELILGNLLRGASIKQQSQLNKYLVGLGVFQVLTCMAFVMLTSVLSSQLLLYFLASFTWPQPWQVTVQDMQDCNQFHNNEAQCNAFAAGALCSFVPKTKNCIASPTGKAMYFYLQQLSPSEVDSTLNPGDLREKSMFYLTFVWVYILGYMWRGLFKIGFLSAILMIVAVVLCITLAVVSFFVGPDGGAHVSAAVSATFDVYALLRGLADSSYSSSLVRSMCHDLCLGCGIIGTVASYTKIGYNTCPSGLFTCSMELVMAFVPFVSLLSIIGNLAAVTSIPLDTILRRTGSAAAFFVVFPAAFEKVSSPSLFGLFFYGGVFLINTQVAAIGIHSVFNAIMESRVVRGRWRQALSTCLVLVCYALSLPFCSNDQQQRMHYATYIVLQVMIPLSVSLSTLYVGWFMNFEEQARLVGRKATILYGGLCLVFGITFIIAVTYGKKGIFLPSWIIVFVNAALAAFVAAVIRDGEATVTSFKERFLGLYLGGMRVLHQEVTRVTLFAPAQARLGAVFGVLPLLLCGCLTRPFFLLRTSTYWCVCVKHLIPVVMAVCLSGSLSKFAKEWESVGGSIHVRNCGAALLGVGVFFILVLPFIPKVRCWVRPEEEDYMPVSCFPTRPAIFKKPVSLLRLFPSLFQEHLARSGQPSSIVKSLVLDYKKHQLLTMPSTPSESGVTHNADTVSRHPSPQKAGVGLPGCVSPKASSHIVAFGRRHSDGSESVPW